MPRWALAAMVTATNVTMYGPVSTRHRATRAVYTVAVVHADRTKVAVRTKVVVRAAHTRATVRKVAVAQSRSDVALSSAAPKSACLAASRNAMHLNVHPNVLPNQGVVHRR